MSINIIGLNLEKFCYKKHTQMFSAVFCFLFVELCSKLLRVLLWSLLSLLFPFLNSTIIQQPNKTTKKEFNIFIQIILMIFINFILKPPFLMCVIQLQGYIFMAFLGAKKLSNIRDFWFK